MFLLNDDLTELKTLLAARGEKCLHVEEADKKSPAYDRV